MINLSFAGCGFLGIYHVGVASCFREYAPQVLVSRIAGASVGSIAAAALICDVSLGETTSAILSVAREARMRSLGPLSPRFSLNTVLRTRLEAALPPNAHRLCSGKLFISVTRWRDMKNVLLSQFDTREELIQAILCSCFIPFYSGIAKPKFQGEEYVDGGLTDNLPVLDENTVTVSPFAGEHDICPQDESCNILQVNLVNTSIALSPRNIYRLARILFPPEPTVLNKMCQQGFDDALKFLQRKNVITCTRCLGIQSTIQFRQPDAEVVASHPFDGCDECKKKRNMAKVGSLPIAVVDAIQLACDEVNKGVYNWIFRRRPMKLLSLLALPYTLPLDITIVIFAKIWEQLPSLRKEMLQKFTAIVDLIKVTLKKFNEPASYSARFSCELAVTEFDYTPEAVPETPYANGHAETTAVEVDETPQQPPKRTRKLSNRASTLPDLSKRSRMQQRKSYAGLGMSSVVEAEDTRETAAQAPARRKSLSEVTHPERVIRNMRFGFTIGMSEVTQSDRDRDFFQSLKSLGEEDNEVNIVELTNQALKMERECIKQYLHSRREDSLSNSLDAPDNVPIMSYSYMDEDETVRMTEIYKVTDADNSRVLTDDERRVNGQLEWESDWVDPPEGRLPRSITDQLDDDEFNTSDNECDLTPLPDHRDEYVDEEASWLNQEASGSNVDWRLTVPSEELHQSSTSSRNDEYSMDVLSSQVNTDASTSRADWPLESVEVHDQKSLPSMDEWDFLPSLQSVTVQNDKPQSVFLEQGDQRLNSPSDTLSTMTTAPLQLDHPSKSFENENNQLAECSIDILSLESMASRSSNGSERDTGTDSSDMRELPMLSEITTSETLAGSTGLTKVHPALDESDLMLDASAPSASASVPEKMDYAAVQGTQGFEIAKPDRKTSYVIVKSDSDTDPSSPF